MTPRRSTALSAAERKASAELNAIAYPPCEECGEHVYTALRDLGGGIWKRLCSSCASSMGVVGG